MDDALSETINQSVLFTAADLKHLITKKNEQLNEFFQMYDQKTILEKDREELRKQLNSQLAQTNINFEQETQKRISEALA